MDKPDIIAEAKKRFEYALSQSSENREKAKEDIRFAASSPDDPWQWDQRDAKTRELQMRPMLTINKMPQHIRQVTNDIRQNRPSVRFRPADNKADPEVADILMGLVRHIEANSDADIAYDTAAENQVIYGLGYIRVIADYVGDDSFDQDIFIKRVKNSFQCFDDPDIKDPAGADREFFFIEEMIDEKEFKDEYPDATPIDWNFTDSWFSGDKKVRVVEYFSVEEKEKTLYLWANGTTSFKGDKLPDGVYPDEKPLKERKSTEKIVMWRKLNGQEVLEEKRFPCKWIPVARVVGNEYEVDGKPIISGLVRNAKDSQRMYNVAQSAIVERVMQSPKTPWTIPVEAVEGYEKEWQSANSANHAFLPYNHLGADGQPVPAPTRVQPTMVESGLAQIASGASDDIKSETGQYDASLGQRSNETSGKAIMARQREGDTATYHYVDNLSRAIRHIGRIILDMIPQVYDTKRVARILGEDDSAANVTLDPENQEPLTEYKDEKGAMQRIFNPNIGHYDVYTTTGPSFTTRRVEAVEAMTQMTLASPGLWQVIGDQLVKNMDWPGAEEMSERLKVTLIPPVQEMLNKDQGQADIPPQIKQAMDQMQQQVQQLGKALENAAAHASKLETDKEIEFKKLLIEAYGKETDRLKITSTAMNPNEIQALVMQTLQQVMQAPDPMQSVSEDISEQEQQEGAPQDMAQGMPPGMPPPSMPPEGMPQDMSQQQPPQAGGFFSPQVPQA